ncbi:hypothetical protein MTP04_23700 [Lysinibacillus sp. PLM2]|nr:hypothetical protein MTP04_23700 [Lysinibacillus sp. PLM2]
MSLYFQTYSNVLKKNFMLVIMASVLLVLTFYIWVGFAIFIVGASVAELTANLIIIHLSISISGGFLFSLFFLPINLKVAKNIAEIKERSKLMSFIRLELVWILICSLIFEIILRIVFQA